MQIGAGAHLAQTRADRCTKSARKFVEQVARSLGFCVELGSPDSEMLYAITCIQLKDQLIRS